MQTVFNRCTFEVFLQLFEPAIRINFGENIAYVLFKVIHGVKVKKFVLIDFDFCA